MAFAIRVLMAARAPHVMAAAAILVWSGFSYSALAACVVSSDTAVVSVQRIPAPEAGSERLLQLGDRIAIKVKNLGDLLKDPNCTSKAALFLDGQALKGRDYAVATNQGSSGFLLDILSDADGVSVHRFQLFAWTIILGVVFVSAVLHEVAMPVFSATLLGLMGLSAGTYLGLKIPEPTVPKQPPTPP